MYPDLIFSAQSAALRVWAGALGPDDLATPSALAGWSVADLLAHLVAVHDGVAALRPVQDITGGADTPDAVSAAHTGGTGNAGGTGNTGRTGGTGNAGDAESPDGTAGIANPANAAGGSGRGATDALSVAEYVRGYPSSADRTAHLARTIARDTADDPLRAWDSASEEARRTLAALGAADRLVTTRRGPMMASAYLTTRVIELVVHAGDLHRCLPHRPAPPVLPSARAHVLTALREVLTARHPDPAVLAAASALDEQDFLDLATGRGEPPSAGLPAVLAAALPLL